MAIKTVAMIVTAANRTAVAAALSALTPHNTVGFIRACCAADEPSPTFETEPTHFYTNTIASTGDAEAWESAVLAAAPGVPLHGLVVFTATNAINPLAWATTNLDSQNLRFVPDEE